jgi:VanZ family protein
MKNNKLSKWIPAFVVMVVIFLFSSQPSGKLPDFGLVDRIIKKGGHMFEYGILALSYWYAFGWARPRRWLAWLLAVLYAASDEYHQTFVLGRHPSIWDVLIFDNFGALISLWITSRVIKRKLSDETT